MKKMKYVLSLDLPLTRCQADYEVDEDGFRVVKEEDSGAGSDDSTTVGSRVCDFSFTGSIVCPCIWSEEFHQLRQ